MHEGGQALHLEIEGVLGLAMPGQREVTQQATQRRLLAQRALGQQALGDGVGGDLGEGLLAPGFGTAGVAPDPAQAAGTTDGKVNA